MPKFSLASMFAVTTGLCLGLGLLMSTTLPYLLRQPFLQLLLICVSSAGLVAVLVLFAFFLHYQR